MDSPEILKQQLAALDAQSPKFTRQVTYNEVVVRRADIPFILPEECPACRAKLDGWSKVAKRNSPMETVTLDENGDADEFLPDDYGGDTIGWCCANCFEQLTP